MQVFVSPAPLRSVSAYLCLEFAPQRLDSTSAARLTQAPLALLAPPLPPHPPPPHVTLALVHHPLPSPHPPSRATASLADYPSRARSFRSRWARSTKISARGSKTPFYPHHAPKTPHHADYHLASASRAHQTPIARAHRRVPRSASTIRATRVRSRVPASPHLRARTPSPRTPARNSAPWRSYASYTTSPAHPRAAHTPSPGLIVY